jgi:predicted porin
MKMAKMKALALSMAVLGSALVALPVQAQTNVTFYGRINTSWEYTEIEDQPSVNRLVNNSSRIGFRGNEELGNGLSALFQFEGGFDSDVGNFRQRRDTFVGLKSNLGTVKMGYITSPLYYATHDYISMHNHDTGTSSDALLWFPAYDPDDAVFIRNSITYATPSFGGFMLEGQYSMLSEQASDTAPSLDANGDPIPSTARGGKPKHYSITGTYDNGPLHLGLGMVETRDYYNFAGGDSKDRSITASAFYDFKVVAVGALYERSDSENGGLEFLTGVGGSQDRNSYRLAVMVPVGAHEFHVNAALADDWSNTDDTGAKQYTLAYNYNLSKRTKVYAFWTEVDNDNAEVGGGGGGFYGFLPGAPAGKDNSSYAIGLRHAF